MHTYHRRRHHHRRHHHRRAAAVLLGFALAGCAQAAQTVEAPPEPPAAWAWEMPRCAAYQPEEYEAQRHRLSATVTTGGTVTEVYEPGWGAKAVAEIRLVLGTCGSYEYGEPGDPEEFREQHLLVRDGFAADDSLLVESVRLTPPEPPTTWYAVVVRHGDVVATCRTTDPEQAQTRCLSSAPPARATGGEAPPPASA